MRQHTVKQTHTLNILLDGVCTKWINYLLPACDSTFVSSFYSQTKWKLHTSLLIQNVPTYLYIPMLQVYVRKHKIVREYIALYKRKSDGRIKCELSCDSAAARTGKHSYEYTYIHTNLYCNIWYVYKCWCFLLRIKWKNTLISAGIGLFVLMFFLFFSFAVHFCFCSDIHWTIAAGQIGDVACNVINPMICRRNM